jgi:hypothetical protein
LTLWQNSLQIPTVKPFKIREKIDGLTGNCDIETLPGVAADGNTLFIALYVFFARCA